MQKIRMGFGRFPFIVTIGMKRNVNQNVIHHIIENGCGSKGRHYFCLVGGCPQTLHNSLLILESVLRFRQRRKYGSYSMCVNLLAGNRSASQKDGIIQETLYEKYPVLPLKQPVLIQMEECQKKNCLKIGNSLWEWIYEPTGAQSKSGWRKEVSLNV